MLIRDNGEKSNTKTILWASWFIAVFLILLSVIDMDKQIWGFTLRPIEPTIILFLLAPSSGLYAFRKKQKMKEIEQVMDKIKK